MVQSSTIGSVRMPRKIFYGWLVVLASLTGLAFGTTANMFFALGVFIQPITSEFGWTVSQFALGSALVSYAIVAMSPLQGILLDRFGVRAVLLPSSVLFAAGIVLLSVLPPNLPAFYIAVIVLTVVGLGTYPASYAKIASEWFNRRLGLAIGVINAGGGVGAALLPILAQTVISQYGWRVAFQVLGLTSFLMVFLPTFLLVRNRASDMGLAKDGDARTSTSVQGKEDIHLEGFTFRQALSQRSFILIAIAFFMMGIVTTGLLTNQVPLLIGIGHSPMKAALIQSTFGVAMILGRLIGGYLLDFVFAPYLMIAFLVGPIIALAIYSFGPTSDIVFLCSFLLGLAVGAEADVLAYFTKQFFGNIAYGKIFGVLYGIFQLGSGVGSFGLAFARVNWDGYVPGLLVLIIVALGACCALACIGRAPKLPTLREL